MHEELQAILRNDFKAFLEKCFETLNPGQEFHDNWHIDAMSYHLMQIFNKDTKRLIITLPPRHLKSLAVSVAFPAWVLGHMPEKRIIAISYSEPLASYFSRDCRRIMEEPWYKEIFPKARFNKNLSSHSKCIIWWCGCEFGEDLVW